MGQGVLLVVFSGLCWAGVGIAYSRAAMRGVAPAQMVFVASAFVTLFASALAQWTQVSETPSLAALSGWMALAGLCYCIGLLCLQTAMARGSHGAAWGVAQAAFVAPFLVAALVHGEEPGWLRWSGLVAALAGLWAVSAAREEGGGSSGRWQPWALAAFGCFGLQQIAFQWPSHWDGWQDTARVRLPLFMLSIMLTAGVAVCVRRQPLSRQVLAPALCAASVNLVTQKCMAAGLDRLALNHAAAIGYPLAIATGITAFTVYSLTIRRERPGRMALAGLAVVVTGAGMLAWGGAN